MPRARHPEPGSSPDAPRPRRGRTHAGPGPIPARKPRAATGEAVGPRAPAAGHEFPAAFHASSVALALTRASDGCVADANAAFLELFGCRREQVIGRTVADLKLRKDAYDGAPALGPRNPPRPERLPSPAGPAPELVSSAVPILLGGEAHRLEFHVDVGELTRTTELLQQARTELTRVARAALLGGLTASIAHEVKQPLTGVITNAEACVRWLSGAQPDVDEAIAGLRRIIRDAHRAADVVSRIRCLLKNTKPVKAPVPAGEMLRDALALLDSEVRRRGIALRTRIDANTPALQADRVQLQQVLLNLVMNSLDACAALVDRRPEIAIEVTRVDANVQVAVSDNGIGLSDEQLGRIFEPFFTTKDHGMGMGLSISRAIIEAHGGRLWALHNEGPGVRVLFQVPCQ